MSESPPAAAPAMLVRRMTRSDAMPPGAVQLSPREACERQQKYLLEWKPDRDVWPIFAGPQLMLVASLFTSYYINHYYRLAYRVGGAGRVISYTIVLSTSTWASYVMYHEYTYKNLLLGRAATRPYREGVAFGARQLLASAAYPLLFSSFMGMYYAIVTNSVPLPPLLFPLTRDGVTHHVRDMARIWRQRSRGLWLPLGGLVAVQLMGSVLLVRLQVDSVATVERKMQHRVAVARLAHQDDQDCEDDTQ